MIFSPAFAFSLITNVNDIESEKVSRTNFNIIMAMATIVGQFKDATNPFVRLITAATTEDGNMNVPYYQIEEIREASFQSDYACESIHRAILQRIEYYNYPFIVSKCLCLMRVLMMEGPASFNHKMGAASGRLLHIINDSNEVRKNTVEERNKFLAGAIHQAISGDSKALVNFGDPNGKPNNVPPKATTATAGGASAAPSHKSEFQLQQEREQRNHRKRIEDEKRGGAMVVSDRLLDSFDGTLTPVKLVESVTSSPKKKFAPEEIDSFVSATLQTEKVPQVCAALDAVLRDGKSSLQNRFKVLAMVEALATASSDAQQYFKGHPLGWQRHLSIERVDNPAKAEAAKSVAQRISALVVNAVPQIQTASSARPRGSSTVVVAQPQTSSSSSNFSSNQQQFQQQPAKASAQWEWNGPSAVPTSAVGNLDDLFSNMSVRNGSAAPQQQQQPTNSFSSNNFWNSGPPAAPPQQQQQFQQQQYQQQFNQPQYQQYQGPPPQQYQQQPQPQPQQYGFPSPALAYQTPAVPNNSMVFSYSSTDLPPAPNNSFVALPPPQQQQQVEAPPPTQAELLRKQMEEFQLTMMRMMQQAQQQQQQQTAAPAVAPVVVPAPLPSSPPQPAVQQQHQQPIATTTPEKNIAEAPTAYGATDDRRQNAETDDAEEESPSSAPSNPQESTSAAPVAASTSPPPGAPGAHNEAAIAMMLQLQQQMEATQRMLAQQQAAFQALSAQVLGTAPPPPQ
ncbi:Hypothetical protein, putative [Bodo saltans]|uniref:ENTH domain-containing protein n=1 Tax=Bodo saltans TaxID=75058 RepID=A0A0S4J9A1_BODSA|nr:Hypothetical protein, putative [Bodo saltans]|eukprot:CUG87998.1 Hypothetical protein, putative [Bodo saltans]